MKLTTLSLLFLSSICVAFATPPVVVFSTIPTENNSIIPGQGGSRFVAFNALDIPAFDALRVSANGQNWVAIGRIGTPQGSEAALVVGSGWSAPFVRVPVRVNQATPWDSPYESIGEAGGIDINDSGEVVFAGNDFNSVDDDFLATLSGNTVTKIRAEGDLAAGAVFAGARYFGPFQSVNIDSTGKPYFHVSVNATNQVQYVGEVARYVTRQTAIRDIDNNICQIIRFTENSFRVSEDGARSVFLATLRVPVGVAALCFVVDGRVILQRNRIISGSGMPNEVERINPRMGYSSQGNYIVIGANEPGVLGHDDWVFSNGRVLARRNGLITPNSTLRWFNGEFGEPFQNAAINNLNETVIGGFTTDPNQATRYKLVCNQRVFASVGDEVDMDGDGNGDGLFIESFYPGNDHLDDSLYYTCVVKLRKPSAVVGEALLRFKIQLPGDIDNNDEVGPSDFARLSLAFGSERGEPGYDPDADLNGDGSVGPADFSILQTHFGRFR